MILSKEIPESVHSKIIIEIKCDCCNNIFNRRYDRQIKSNKTFSKDVCKKCMNIERGKNSKGIYRVSKEKIEQGKLKRLELYKIKYPKFTFNCARCSKEFTVTYARRNKAKYCSRKCQIDSVKGWNTGQDSRNDCVCLICNKNFKSYKKQLTCSNQCHSNYMSKMRLGENNPNFIPKEDLDKSLCPTCETIFSYPRSGLHKNQKRLFCLGRGGHPPSRSRRPSSRYDSPTPQ